MFLTKMLGAELQNWTYELLLSLNFSIKIGLILKSKLQYDLGLVVIGYRCAVSLASTKVKA